MDEVKIWALDGESGAVALKSTVQTTTESLLEETLVRNPDLLLPGLRLVGRQTPTAGGPLDLLGVGQDGRLVVFELKRGPLSREAVAQIIDYASDLDSKTDDALAEHIVAHSGVGGIGRIEDFEEWYGKYTDAGNLDALRPLRLVLVGLGVDAKTERMVRFLAENTGMDISLLTFHGFAYDGKTFLARQVEVEAADTVDEVRPGSKAAKMRALVKRAEEFGVSRTFGAARGMFQEKWPRANEVPQPNGLSIRLQQRAYACVRVESEGIQIVYYAPAKNLCLEEFRQIVKEIRYETWPASREPVDDPETEIRFKLTAEEWDQHAERLSALTQAVYGAWAGGGPAEL